MNFNKIAYYFALIIGLHTTALFLLLLVPEGICGLLDGSLAVIPILGMMLFSILGFFLVFKNPGKGGLVMVSGGIVMTIYLLFMGGLGEYKMALVFGLPFIVPGLIFYFNKAKGLFQKG